MTTKRNYLVVKHSNYVEYRISKELYKNIKNLEQLIKVILLPGYVVYLLLETLYNELENY